MLYIYSRQEPSYYRITPAHDTIDMSSYQYWQLPKPTERTGFETLSLQTGSTSALKPKPNQVVVRVHAVSLNYRDLIIAKNKYPLYLKDGPVIPTSDGAGVVEAVGEDVQEWKAGDRVVGIFIVSASRCSGAIIRGAV